MAVNPNQFSNWNDLKAQIDAARQARIQAADPFGQGAQDGFDPNNFSTTINGQQYSAKYGDDGSLDYLANGTYNDPTNYRLGPSGENGKIANAAFAPDNSNNWTTFARNVAIAAAPFAPYMAGFGAPGAGATTGAFDLGGVSGGVAGAGGETGLGATLGLGDASLPSLGELSSFGNAPGITDGGSFLNASAEIPGEAAPGAAPAFSDAGYAAQAGIDPAYVGANTASGFGPMLNGVNNFLGTGIGKLAASAAPGILGSLLNKSPTLGGASSGSLIDAANAQGQANSQAALNSSMLSNPNINTPYGSQTVQYGLDGNPYHATINQTLSPAQQALFDQQNAISKGMGSLAQNSIGQVAQSLGSPFDQSKLPPVAQANQQGWDRAFNAIIDRNQPLMDRDQSMLDQKLANQGIFNGSAAYQNAQKDQAQKVNDFRLGAQQQATAQEQSQFGMDSQARQDAIQQQNFFRQQPLNELNALRSGSQVTNPTFQGYSPVNQTAAPIFQGAQAQQTQNNNLYNAQTASNNALTSGLFSLGSAALQAPKGTFTNLFNWGS